VGLWHGSTGKCGALSMSVVVGPCVVGGLDSDEISMNPRLLHDS